MTGQFLLAVILDALIGDPRWLWHPVRTIGSVISRLEKFLRRFTRKATDELIAGGLLTVVVVGGTYAFGYLVVNSQGVLQTIYLGFAYPAIVVYLTASCIAYRELIASAKLVLRHLEANDIWGARKSLSMIVGRDTSMLDEKGICKAVIETVSENLSDGVVAPIFYYIIGGLPLALTYKAVNTLDSMLGYRNDRYEYFGKASAKLDDLANYIPARITGVLISVSALIYGTSLRSFKVMLRDGRQHLSPNSGIPEASSAGALGVRLGGPSFYSGVLVKKPYIGDELTTNYRQSAYKMLRLALVVYIITVLCSASVLAVIDGTMNKLLGV